MSQNAYTQPIQQVLELLPSMKIKRAYLFGSYANGSETPKSDIDILIEMESGTSLLTLNGYRIDMEEKTGKHVDLTTRDALSPRLAPIILNEMKLIYERKG